MERESPGIAYEQMAFDRQWKRGSRDRHSAKDVTVYRIDFDDVGTRGHIESIVGQMNSSGKRPALTFRLWPGRPERHGKIIWIHCGDR